MKCLVTFVSHLHLIWIMSEVHTHVCAQTMNHHTRAIAKHVSYLTWIVGYPAGPEKITIMS